MNRHSKRISPYSTGRISVVKGHILNSNGRGFDGDGYVFKEAIRQLRKDGACIRYDRKKCLYFMNTKGESNHV